MKSFKEILFITVICEYEMKNSNQLTSKICNEYCHCSEIEIDVK